MESLSPKAAIVAGGTPGIGRAIAGRLLRQGASVAIRGRARETVDRASISRIPQSAPVIE
jgi:NAD(P)-dependent dehydrogenase (short-subunit alcohol dehydrogenase family)